jgi:hypothetical protein
VHSDSVLHAAVKSRITAPLSMTLCVSHTCLCVLLQLRSFPTRMACCCGQVLCGSMRWAEGAVDPCDFWHLRRHVCWCGREQVCGS